MRLIQRDPHPFSRLARFLAIALFITTPVLAESMADGPYVRQQDDSTWLAQWVNDDGSAPRVREQRVGIRGPIVVPAVGSLPEFTVRLRPSVPVAPDEVSLAPGTPLFVVADTHGEYEILVELLQKHRIVDASLRWSFGKGHFAILGDVFDRGSNHTEILWLIYKLEAEAKEAGGAVHLVLGNHEAMVLRGDERYLNPKYRRTVAALRAPNYAVLWNEEALLGRWLRSKPGVLKLGKYLCLHGGISREVVRRRLTLATMNQTIRDMLRSEPPPSAEGTALDRELASFVLGREGPLWYRGYFAREAKEGGFTLAATTDIDAVREFFDVSTILVGHTIVPTITPLYKGRVIAVQVYPHRVEKTGAPVMEGLLIRNGQTFKARIDGTAERLM